MRFFKVNAPESVRSTAMKFFKPWYGFLFLGAILFGVLTTLSSCKQEAVEQDVLWYDTPAQVWEEALPLGNGRLGAMVFGDPINERLQLNEDSMWPSDDPKWDEPDGTPEDLQKIRELLIVGENAIADSLFVDKFSRKKVVRSHQTMGDLFVDFDHDNITDYRRQLNLNEALVSVSYRANGHKVTEKVFASHPHQAIVVEFVTQNPKGLNGTVRMSRPADNGHTTATTKVTPDKLLVMDGEVTQYGGFFDSNPDPITKGVKFRTSLKIDHEGGEIIPAPDRLQLKGVQRAIFYLVSNSSYYFEGYKDKNQEQLKALEAAGYSEVLKAHKEDFDTLYSRTRLKLDQGERDSIPTDQRLAAFAEGAGDLGLEALLFHYGRYLLIASSRPNTNPANLQGLWNPHIEAPWNGDYHLNINLQMNYWPANLTQLDELNEPLFDYIDKLVENGKVTAQKNYGCRGSFIPHATDLWAPTWLRAPTAYWGCSLGAGGWLMQHYWEHYKFTQDQEFLKKRAFPAIREVAQFYSDWLIEDPRDGYLVSAPSTSPENRFFNKERDSVATCMGSAMDQQVIAEVFENYAKACQILNIENELLEITKQQKQRLRPGFILGDDGRVLEWDREYEEVEPGHRHMSHLYGFHPGTSITQSETPELFSAVRKTLDYRLENGGAGTGWSRAWLINCSARLLDGAMAQEHIKLLFQKSMYPNLFDAHPPFQIDGNFGYTAGVAEMLLQSHEKETLRLLPALPPNWETGSVKGLKARGDITVDMAWQNNELQSLVLVSSEDKKIKLVYGDHQKDVDLKKDEKMLLEGF